jgi:hypothetical protein
MLLALAESMQLAKRRELYLPSGIVNKELSSPAFTHPRYDQIALHHHGTAAWIKR